MSFCPIRLVFFSEYGEIIKLLESSLAISSTVQVLNEYKYGNANNTSRWPQDGAMPGRAVSAVTVTRMRCTTSPTTGHGCVGVVAEGVSGEQRCVPEEFRLARYQQTPEDPAAREW